MADSYSKVTRPKFEDLTGKIYSRLTVLHLVKTTKHGTQWSCRCICEGIIDVLGHNLKSGNTRSCGCFNKKRIREALRKHGLSGSRVWGAWQNMLRRCYSVKDISYKNYGGRGVTVCARWRTSLQFFVEDMGPPPPDMTLDRIDNNKSYEPGNCRWTTHTRQQRNRRNNTFIIHHGLTLTLAEWGDRTGIKIPTLCMRLMKYKWPVDKALTFPVR